MRKNYTPKYKAEAMLEVLREAESLNKIAGRMGISPNMLGLHTVFEDSKGEEKRVHEAEFQDLYAQIGEISAQA